MRKNLISAAVLLALTVSPLAGMPMLDLPTAAAAAARTDNTDGYVAKVRAAQPQQKLDCSKLKIPAAVRLADSKATPRTAALAAFLHGVGGSGSVLYGHQNDLHHKVNTSSRNPSDTYDAVRDYPAVVGFDVQAMEGGDFSLTPEEARRGLTLSEKMAAICRAGDKNGVIFTMSAHMPNFDVVARRGKTARGYDYTGYSSPVTDGNVVQRILPGGDLNEVYRGYLDMMAEFGSRLQQADIPVICRLFHEDDGSWFWWGASYCSPAQYKNLYRYTVEYLRDTKGIHNFLYAYSPGGPVNSEADYLSRYPGDEYVDVVGFDMYHRDPQARDGFMDSLGRSLSVLQSFARSHEKIMAGTEVGILARNGAMANTGNQRKDWFREALHVFAGYDTAYFMTWSNNNRKDFDQPYMVGRKRGHEMINEFVDFYNDPQSVFASQLDYHKVQARAEAVQGTYGYFTSPLMAVNGYERYTKPEKITARLMGGPGKVQVLLRRQDQSIAVTIPAQSVGDGQWKAELGQTALDQIGAAIGSMELQADGRTMDSVKVIFNTPESPADPLVVDDFSRYYGENALLKAAYSENCGPGCSVRYLLTTGKDGAYGMDFHYSLIPNGYAGIIHNLRKANWSSANALQFVYRPDGKGQNYIIQLNSKGEDFEVHLADFLKGNAQQLVTIPFTAFKGKQHGVFDRSQVEHFAIYCNAVGDTATDSVLHFAGIRAVHKD